MACFKQQANGNRSSRSANTITIHRRLIILGEDVDVAKAVREMHSQKAEIIIVVKETRPVEIVTDSNILDNVEKGEKLRSILPRSIASSPVISYQRTEV